MNYLLRQVVLFAAILAFCTACKTGGSTTLEELQLGVSPEKLEFCFNPDDSPPPPGGVQIGLIAFTDKSTPPNSIDIRNESLTSPTDRELRPSPTLLTLDSGETGNIAVFVTEYYEGTKNIHFVLTRAFETDVDYFYSVTGKKCPQDSGGGGGGGTGGGSAKSVVTQIEAAVAMIQALLPKTADSVGASSATVTPSGNIALAGSNGWAVVDPLTGATVNSKGLDLGSTAKYAAAEVVDPGTGTIAIFAVGPQGTTLNHWIPAQSAFGITQLGSLGDNVTDFCRFPDGSGGTLSDFTLGSVQFLTFDSGSGLFTVGSSEINEFGFINATGHVVSACAEGPQSRIFAVTDGTPGSLYYRNAGSPFANLIGSAGNGPRNLRMLGNLIVVSNFDNDTLTVARADTLTIALPAVPVGDGPVGIDLKELSNGDISVVSTGLNDNTYSITEFTSDGALVSNTRTAAPGSCTAPGHALWYKDGVLITCRDTDTIEYIVP